MSHQGIVAPSERIESGFGEEGSSLVSFAAVIWVFMTQLFSPLTGRYVG